jgi:hypothetical protein
MAVGQAEEAAKPQESLMGRSDVTYRGRAKVLNHARQLARSGAYPDHKSIIPHLESLDGFEAVRERVEDRFFRLQLDRICALVRGSAS